MDIEFREFRREYKKLKRELDELTKGIEFLSNSRTTIINKLDNLGPLSGCNMYANYHDLKMRVKDEVNSFYNALLVLMVRSKKDVKEKLYRLTVTPASEQQK